MLLVLVARGSAGRKESSCERAEKATGKSDDKIHLSVKIWHVVQVNELDAAHIIYEKALLAEKESLLEQAEKAIEDALQMQEYLFGESHPQVRDD